MNEQQADYDSDTGDTQPTPGPWSYSKQNGESGAAFLAQVWGADGDSLAVIEPQHPHIDEATANARLIAAAGTAASEIQEDLNVIDLFRELPKIIRAADRAVDSTRFRDEDGQAHPPDRSHMVYLRNALNAVRKDTTQTDE
jgi:hypothetical protein